MHELTCQILTNQNIIIGGRVWPTRDRGEKSQKQLHWLIFRVRGQFEFPIFKSAAHKHNLFPIHFKKLNLRSRSFDNY